MTFRRITALLLLVAMSLTMFAACGTEAQGEYNNPNNALYKFVA